MKIKKTTLYLKLHYSILTSRFFLQHTYATVIIKELHDRKGKMKTLYYYYKRVLGLLPRQLIPY